MITIRLTYYDILGIEEDATQDEIHKAYKQAAIAFHPDKNKQALSEILMRMANEAYEVLRDEHKRVQYNVALINDRKAKQRSKKVELDPFSFGPASNVFQRAVGSYGTKMITWLFSRAIGGGKK